MRGAVSLSFDDGRKTQAKVVIPQLNKRGLRGTFYLCPGHEGYIHLMDDWVQASEDGHEIGNHTMTHPCSLAFQDDPSTSGLETMSLDDIERDILEAERILERDFPESGPRSFCYPCYQTHVGSGLTRQSYVPIVARHFIAGRAAGEHGFFNHPMTCDPFALWSTPADHLRGEHLIGLAERAAAQGRWLILAFHDVGDDRLGTLSFDFMEFLDFLARNSVSIWTATVRDVALTLRKNRLDCPQGPRQSS